MLRNRYKVDLEIEVSLVQALAACHVMGGLRMNLMLTIALMMTLFLTPVEQDSDSRTWMSANSQYSIKADLVAYNDTTIVLKRGGTEKLLAVEIAQLSEADRKFLADKREADRAGNAASSAKDWHTWTSASGWQIRGRVLAYGRKELVVESKSGAVSINGKSFSSLEGLQQKLVLAVLSKLEEKPIEDEQDIRTYLGSIQGQPKKYTLEGVMLQLESGDQVPVPFFMFSQRDQDLLSPGWEAWSAAEDDSSARAREDFLVQQEANQYQEMQQRQARHEQMEVLKLNLLATAVGVTSIWEVALYPGPGTRGRPLTVVVSARNSQAAAQLALQQHRGYVVGPIRKVSDF